MAIDYLAHKTATAWLDDLADAAPPYIDAALAVAVQAQTKLALEPSYRALTAAETVAALHNAPNAALPQAIAVYVRGKSATPAQVLQARSAVQAVFANSELSDEYSDNDAWEDAIGDLLDRLDQEMTVAGTTS